MSSANLDISENIRKSRQLAGLSLEEVASLSGISERRLARIENGTTDPYVSELLGLCQAIKVAPASIFKAKTNRIHPRVSKQTIEQNLSLSETSELLGVSEATLRTMAKCEEIPHCKIGRSVFFRWTELDDWLDMQFNKRIPGKERRYAVRGTRTGIEPLLSERDTKEIFGGSVPTCSADGRFVPVYYIRSRKKYRLSDILAYIEQAQTDIYSVPRFSRGWRSRAFERIPSQEELDANRLARKFSRGKGDELVPGYEWASTQFSAPSAEEAEQILVDFRDALENKWEMSRTRIDWDGRSYSGEVKYMRIPPAWAGYKVKRVTKSSDYPNLTKLRVQKFLAKNVPKENLIETRYFTDSFFWQSREKHCATISYYVPVEGRPRDPGAILDPQAQKRYEKLCMEATIKIPHSIWRAIDELQAGDLKPSKFAHMLKEADLFERMDNAGLLIYERRDQILDVKSSNKPEYDFCWADRGYYGPQPHEYAHIKRMTREENAEFERAQAEKQEARDELIRRRAAEEAERRQAAISRAEEIYQSNVDTFCREDKAAEIRANISEEDWDILVWLQQHWDEVMVAEKRRREKPSYIAGYDDNLIPALDKWAIASSWSISVSEVSEVFSRLIAEGAIFNDPYREMVAINPFLAVHLSRTIGEEIQPRSWGGKRDTQDRPGRDLRPNAEVLEQLIKSYSNSTIAKVFKVSDVAVKKWMNKFGLKREGRVINIGLDEETIQQIRREVEKQLGDDADS